jgi:hypothetical protein
MCKFPTKILMLAVMALLLSAGVAIADPSSSDWNNSWGFPSPAEKSNLLNQALAIELIEDGGFHVDNHNYYGGNTMAIGSQVVIDIDGDNNDVNDNDASTEGNTAAQTNNGPGSIDQDNSDGNFMPYDNF